MSTLRDFHSFGPGYLATCIEQTSNDNSCNVVLILDWSLSEFYNKSILRAWA